MQAVASRLTADLDVGVAHLPLPFPRAGGPGSDDSLDGVNVLDLPSPSSSEEAAPFHEAGSEAASKAAIAWCDVAEATQ